MNNRLDIAGRLTVQAGPQASSGPSSSSSAPAGSRRVVLPDARPGPRGRVRRLLDRPWTGLPTTGRVVKRLMDIGVSAVLLLLFAPLFAIVALAASRAAMFAFSWFWDSSRIWGATTPGWKFPTPFRAPLTPFRAPGVPNLRTWP